jgi:Na+/H+-dicarboxylate symporter
MAEASAAAPAKPWYKILYIQVLLAILLGAILGWLFPDFGKNDWVKALGDGFVKLIRMVIAPIIFCTVVSGIAHISEVKKIGRVAVKALVYFEVVSTFALLLGLIVANVLHPGAGFSGKTDASAVAGFAKQASEMKSVDFVLHTVQCVTFTGIMSERGQKRTWRDQIAMSALPPTADIRPRDQDVCFGPKPDSCTAAKPVIRSPRRRPPAKSEAA